MTTKSSTPASRALIDIGDAVRAIAVPFGLGWRDVSQRYRRSQIGAFWITINLGVLVTTMWFIFGALFNADPGTFLPHLAIGLIVWSYISSSLIDSCTAFVAAEGLILHLPSPLFTHVLRSWFRNIVIFGHNIIIIPFVYIFTMTTPSASSFLFLPGVLILMLSVLGGSLILSVICTRFRDVAQIVQNILQVVFYLTPIVWTSNHLPMSLSWVETWNPAVYLLRVTRGPLTGMPPAALDWFAAMLTMIICSALGFLIFSRYRTRIAFWL